MGMHSKGNWVDYVSTLYPKFSFWTATKCLDLTFSSESPKKIAGLIKN